MIARKIFWALAVFAFAVLGAAAVWLGGLNQDEGWYLYAANLVAEGKMLYRDFFYTQGPAMPSVYKSFILGGGVSLNSRIRAVLTEVAKDAGVPLLMAKPKYTGDNGAMIAGLAYYRRNHVEDAMTLDVNPCLEVGK